MNLPEKTKKEINNIRNYFNYENDSQAISVAAYVLDFMIEKIKRGERFIVETKNGTLYTLGFEHFFLNEVKKWNLK